MCVDAEPKIIKIKRIILYKTLFKWKKLKYTFKITNVGGRNSFNWNINEGIINFLPSLFKNGIKVKDFKDLQKLTKINSETKFNERYEEYRKGNNQTFKPSNVDEIFNKSYFESTIKEENGEIYFTTTVLKKINNNKNSILGAEDRGVRVFSTIKDISGNITEIGSQKLDEDIEKSIEDKINYLNKDLNDLKMNYNSLNKKQKNKFKRIKQKIRKLRNLKINQGINKIIKICDKIDLLSNQKDKLYKNNYYENKNERKIYKNKRNKFNKQINYLKTKINNLRNDLFYKYSNYLTKNFKELLIPNYRTSEMVAKGFRKIRKVTVFKLLKWENYRFSKILKDKSIENNCNFLNCTEEWTSKCCRYCLRINNELKGEEIFKCSFCNHIEKRDWNASGNCIMKNIHLSSIKEISQINTKN